MTHVFEGKSFQLSIGLHMKEAGLLSFRFLGRKSSFPVLPSKMSIFYDFEKKSKWLPFEK